MKSRLTHSATGHAAFALYPELQTMFDEFPKYRSEILPSPERNALIGEYLQLLVDARYENFKRTLATSRAGRPIGKQISKLVRELGAWEALRMFRDVISSSPREFVNRKDAHLYTLLTNLLWTYAEKNDTAGNLQRLTEPLEGNPLQIKRNDRLISRDLATSLLEYESILHPDIDRRDVRTILELEPGYGRTAYVFLELQPGCRYILVDLPPALYVAQRYLSNVFAERKIFGFRPFSTFQDVEEDFAAADIIFITPNQLELLPAKSVDLFLNISSMHDMRTEQIEYYFGEIVRVTQGYFYFKQLQNSTNSAENSSLSESDYPIPDEWRLISRQDCGASAGYFEALYKLP